MKNQGDFKVSLIVKMVDNIPKMESLKGKADFSSKKMIN